MRHAALLALCTSSCSVVTTGLPSPTSVEDRIHTLPHRGLDVAAPVDVRFDAHLVPFIEAGSAEDLAFTVGLVQVHLRRGQLFLLRALARGELASLVGPFAVDVDHTIRVLDFGRAVPAMVPALPDDTRIWLDRFVAGLNAGLERGERSHEERLLGVEARPFTLEDVLTIGRLASADVNWIQWPALMALRDHPLWPEIHAALGGADVVVGRGLEGSDSTGAEGLSPWLLPNGRVGSNAFVLSGARTWSGRPILANDPHLGLQLPNFWLIMGWSMPGVRAVGFAIPGLPVLAVGRTEHLAWGGTNMHAASSDLVPVAPEAVKNHKIRLGVRWWPDRPRTLREGPEGPIVSDAPLLDLGDAPLQLRWMGHRPSDEITPLLRVLRAKSYEGFRNAFEGWAVSGQTFLYAGADGDIGQVLAARVPDRAPRLLPSVVDDRPWAETVGPLDLPALRNPPEGYIVSANDRPEPGAQAVGTVFSGVERVKRMHELLAGPGRLSLASIMAVQGDTVVPAARSRARALCGWGRVEPIEHPLLDAVCVWDGGYRPNSRGALAYELLLAGLFETVLNQGLEPLARLPVHREMGFQLVRDAPERAELIRASLARAESAFEQHERWGDLHRLRVGHVFSNLPLLGGRYVVGEYPAQGGSESLLKSAHTMSMKEHQASYGAQSRFVADLADPDANHFILLGGQDGRLRSEAFDDQVDLWREGRYLQLPITAAAVAEHYTMKVTLQK